MKQAFQEGHWQQAPTRHIRHSSNEAHIISNNTNMQPLYYIFDFNTNCHKRFSVTFSRIISASGISLLDPSTELTNSYLISQCITHVIFHCLVDRVFKMYFFLFWQFFYLLLYPAFSPRFSLPHASGFRCLN